jgi:uncharacterized membrane protein YjfL (UPF0719 family)
MGIVITVVVGLIVWKVIPILTNDTIKRKSYRKAIAVLCKIIGIAIIIMSILNYLKSLLYETY